MTDAVKMRMAIPSQFEKQENSIREIWLASDCHVAIQRNQCGCNAHAQDTFAKAAPRWLACPAGSRWRVFAFQLCELLPQMLPWIGATSQMQVESPGRE